MQIALGKANCIRIIMGLVKLVGKIDGKMHISFQVLLHQQEEFSA